MGPPLRIDVGPPDFVVRFPDGGSLQLYNYADSVGVSQFRSNGDLELHELTHEQYERFRQKLPQYNLPEFKPRAPGTGANGNTVGRVVGESSAAAVPAPAANPPVQAQTPAEASTGTKILDGLQTGLDVAGLVPGFGEFADLGNAAISALRGDWVGAGLSLGAAVPFAGWGATGAKALRKGSQALSKEAAERAAREAAQKAEKEAAERAAREARESAAAKKGQDGGKVKKRDCKLLEKGPPGAKHQGGKHGQVKKDSAVGVRESHHVPPDSVNGLGNAEGPSISMDYADHRAMSSTGRSTTHPTSIAQANLVKSGPAGFLAAMMTEIAEIRQKYGDKYDPAIAWMLLYASCMGFIPGPK